MISGTASVVMAPGPDFTSFDSTGLPSGTFGSPISAYSVLDAGAKRIFLSPGDADTSVITFAVELRGTLFILPRPDVANSRFLFASERYTFATNGIPDSGRVRFLNAIYRGSAATEDIAVDVNMVAGTDTTVAISGLDFGEISNSITVAAGETVSFFLTMADTMQVLTASESVTGAANADYTIVASDSIGAGGTVMFTRYEHE
jgi:hypothetical protein